MSRKFRVLLVAILAMLLSVSLLGLIACGEDEEQTPETNTSSAMSFEKEVINLDVGENVSLVLNKGEVTGDVKWVSYKPEVATVDEIGNVTALSTGKTVIVATVGSESASCDITVSQPQSQAENLLVELSVKQIVLNANSDYNSADISVESIYNGQAVDATVTWSSSVADIVVAPKSTDNSKATVSTSINGVSSIVTATVVYNGITATVSCNVVAEEFAYLVINQEQITMFTDEERVIDYDIYVGGVKNNSKKSNAQYASLNTKVVTVDSNGKLTPVSCGNAKVTVTYGSIIKTILVEVGDVRYVSTPEQFMQIDGGDSLVKYVLINDIDLSDTFNGANSINNEYFFEELNCVLQGDGHTVYGLNRYSTGSYWQNSNSYHNYKSPVEDKVVNPDKVTVSFDKTLDDQGFDGIFKKISGNGKIDNVKFIADVNVTAKKSADTKTSLIVGSNYGVIEDCIFDITVSQTFIDDGETVGVKEYVLLSRNMGKVSNSVVSLNTPSDFATDEKAKLSISTSGNGINTDLSIIACKLTATVTANGLQGTDELTNKFLDNCYLYKTVSDFKNKIAYKLSGTGVSDTTHDFNGDESYDENLFNVNEKVTFVNASVIDYSFSRDVEKDDYETQVNEPLLLNLPANATVKVFDVYGEEVTSTVYSGSTFTSSKAGIYRVLCITKNGNVFTGSVNTVTVLDVVASLDNTSFTLNVNSSARITLNGKLFLDPVYQQLDTTKHIDKTTFSFTSDNTSIASVSTIGEIKGIKGGKTTVRVMDKTTNAVYYVDVTVKDSFNLKEFNGVISTGSSVESKVYVDGVFAGTTSNDKFDLYEYLIGKNKPAGKYEITVENNGDYDHAVYQIINLNNENFVSTIREINTIEKGRYKMFVLTEDITLNPWVDGDFGDISLKSGGYNYVTNNFFSNIDGMGYSLSLAFNAPNATQIFGGLAVVVEAGLRNLEYKLDATYTAGKLRYYFASEIGSGGFTDCVFKINVNCVNASGVPIKDPVRTPMLTNYAFGGRSKYNSSALYKNIVIVYNNGAESKNDFIFSERNVASTPYENIVVISSAQNNTLSNQTSNPKNCYLLNDFNELFYGGDAEMIVKAKRTEDNKTIEYEGKTPVKVKSIDVYGLTSGNFEFTENGLELYGKLVFSYGVIGGDTIIPDSDILSK